MSNKVFYSNFNANLGITQSHLKIFKYKDIQFISFVLCEQTVFGDLCR